MNYIHIATSDLTPGAIVAMAIVNDKGELRFYREFSPGNDTISTGATKVHGLTNESLKNKETFTDFLKNEFCDYIKLNYNVCVYNKKFFCDFFIKHLNETGFEDSEKIKYMTFLKNNVVDAMVMFSENNSFNRLVAQRKQSISLENAFNMILMATYKSKTDLTSVAIKNKLNNSTIFKTYQIYLIHSYLINKNINLVLNKIKNNVMKLNLEHNKQCKFKIIFNKDNKNKYDFIMNIFQEKENLKLYGYKLKAKSKYSIIQYNSENKDDKVKGTAIIDNDEISVQLGHRDFILKDLSFNCKDPIQIMATNSEPNKTVLVLHHTNKYNPFFYGVLNAFVKKEDDLLPVQKSVYAVFKEYEFEELQNKKDNNMLLELVSKEENGLKYGLLEVDLEGNKVYYYPSGIVGERLFTGEYSYSFNGNMIEDKMENVLKKDNKNIINNNSNSNSDVSVDIKDNLIHIVLN